MEAKGSTPATRQTSDARMPHSVALLLLRARARFGVSVANLWRGCFWTHIRRIAQRMGNWDYAALCPRTFTGDLVSLKHGFFFSVSWETDSLCWGGMEGLSRRKRVIRKQINGYFFILSPAARQISISHRGWDVGGVSTWLCSSWKRWRKVRRCVYDSGRSQTCLIRTYFCVLPSPTISIVMVSVLCSVNTLRKDIVTETVIDYF